MIAAIAIAAAAIFTGTGIPLGANLAPTSFSVPYSPNPFTQPICSADPCTPSLPVDPNSASQIAFLVLNVGGFALGEIQQRQPGTPGTTGLSGSYPVYYASSKDPVFTISCDGTAGDCQNAPASLNIPSGARAGGTADHHLIVIEPGMVEYAFDQFNDGGTGTGTTNPVYNGGTVSVKSGGFASSLSMYAGGTASCLTCNASMAARIPAEPTLLDPAEIVNGWIPHTISVAMFCPSSSFFWPANRSDGPCSQGPGEGEYVWLNMTDAQIRALGFCSWETTLLVEMHHYGLFIGDTGAGPEPWDFKSYDDWSQMLWGGNGNWSAFWSWLSSSCPSAVPGFSGGASHMQLLTTGITQSNLEILE